MRLIRLLKNDIAKEAGEWVQDDLITESQAERICERYDVDYHQAQSYSLGYNVLVGLGYLFVGLALITLIGHNWDDIPRAVRMWGLIGLTALTQGLAIRKHASGDLAAANVIFLLGNLFYGASIILIAQIYHLGEHMPDGVFWWALGILPIGILINSPLVTLQAALLALLWFLLEVSMGFYPALFPLFIFGACIVLLRSKQSTLLFLTVCGSVGLWFEYTLAQFWRDGRHFDFQAEHVAVSVALFILAYCFSHWLALKPSARAKDYAAVLAIWSLRFGLIFMLVMSFDHPWRGLLKADWNQQLSMLILVTALSTGSFLLARRAGQSTSTIFILLFYLLSLVAVLLSGNTDHAHYFQIVYNLVLITSGVGLILKGIQRGISHYFFLGIVTILLTAFMRYVDLIGDYIGGAMLFLVFAALLLGAAKYWKRIQSRETVA
jgi:uncharacterized membrane protein